jgi:predicted MFS family arabinose efflux permease
MTRPTGAVRRTPVSSLTIAVCCIVALDALLSTALAPLLPGLARTHHLNKVDSSLLVAGYYVGLASVAVPMIVFAPHISRKGATRDGVLLLGLGTVVFALASTFASLVIARWLQGAGAVMCWANASAWLVDATPAAERGRTIGFVAAMSSGGAVAGPVLGAVASTWGRTPTFVTVGGIAALLALVTACFPEPSRPDHVAPVAALFTQVQRRALALAVWLVSLPSLLLASLGVLGPLALSREGWGALGVGATYCCAALAGLVVRPRVGRWADVAGRFLPLSVLLSAAVPATLAIGLETRPWALAVGLVLTITIYGSLWGPAMALLSDLCSRASVSQALGFMLALLGQAPGAVFGAIVAGASAQVFGDFSAYCLMAGACGATLVGASSIRRALTSPRSRRLRNGGRII